VLQQTSSSSTKLVHGGIRYLEHGYLGLVRESLLDRSWWLKNAPQHIRQIEICMPVYDNSPRSTFKLFSGALLYRILAGRHSLGPTRWRGMKKRENFGLRLRMQDLMLPSLFMMLRWMRRIWVRDKSIAAGMEIFEEVRLERFTVNGEIESSKFGRR